MSVLPVVERELRVAARKSGTYWLRTAAAGILLGLFIFLQSNSRMAATQLGIEMLRWMSMVLLGFTLFAGLFLTADCISQERREGTLGLLFLTTLRGWDVVLGKLAGCSATALFSVLAAIPTLAFPVLIGGVTGGEVFRLGVVLAITLFYSLAQGLLVSVLTRDSRAAVGGAFFLGLLLTGALPALWWLQRAIINSPTLDWLLWPSPAYAYITAFDASFRLGMGGSRFWSSVLTITCLGLCFTAAAALLLTLNWRAQEKPPRPDNSTLPGRRMSASIMLAQNPFQWVALRLSNSSPLQRRAIGLLVVIWWVFLISSLIAPNPIPLFVTSLFTGYGLHILAKIVIATEGVSRFHEDHRTGALELLLVTPLAPRQILVGQVGAMWDRFKWMRRVLLAVNLVFTLVVAGFGEKLKMGGNDQLIFCTMFVGGAIVLTIDSRALAWISMAAALRSSKLPRAVFNTVGKLFALPWIAMFLLLASQRSLRSQQVFWVVVLWQAFGGIVAFVFAARAKAVLHTSLRQLAAGDR